MQQRIFLVPPLGAPPHAEARAHWAEQHGALFVRTPGLRGYRQNRPLDEEWDAGRGWVCSETWYDDRAAERAAYDSTHYLESVAADEATFLHRDRAWAAAIHGDRPPPVADAGIRVLWFGDHPPSGPQWQALPLSRPAPGGGSVVHSAWLSDPEQALALTARALVPAFACRPQSFEIPAPAAQS